MSHSWILCVLASLCLVIFVLCLKAAVAEESAAAKLYDERELAYTGGPYKDYKFKYRLLRPADHDPAARDAGKKWPLILFLHGAGERGNDNKAQLKYFPTDMASSENRAKYSTFLLAPQCPTDRAWSAISLRDLSARFQAEPPEEEKVVLLMLDAVMKEFPVDPDRIYLTGLSMGGFASWDLAARYPEKWAAVVPICGGGDPGTAGRFKDLPIWVFHGGKDPVVPPDRSRTMIEALKKAGGSPKFTEFPDAGHDSWTPGYRLPEFLPWLFAQKRGAATGGAATPAAPAGGAGPAAAQEPGRTIKIEGDSTVLGVRDAVVAPRREGNAPRRAPGFWADPARTFTWRIEAPEAMELDVSITYGCAAGSGGSQVEVACGESKAKATVIETGRWRDLRTLPLGLISVPKGSSEIVLRAKEKAPSAAGVMRVEKIELDRGFVSLFDGKSLEGWYGPRDGQGKRTKVEGYQAIDGILTCMPGGNIYAEKEYSDFVFRFEFRLEKGSNNGLGIRTPDHGDAAYVGMEIQILDDPSYEGQIQPWQHHGSIYNLFAAKPGQLRPTGEWNTEEVTAKGRQVTVKLNGVTIVDANLDDAKDPEGRHKEGLPRTSGYIGFLGHGSKVEFRDIRVKDLAGGK
jgi:pimeloyl-ACP methyl ester carboxylesterase